MIDIISLGDLGLTYISIVSFSVTENIDLNWDLMSDDKAIKGQYNVQVYTDDQFLGESVFTLK